MTEISTPQPLRCSSMTKQEKPCKGYAVSGQTTCVAHTPEIAKLARSKGVERSREVRKERVEQREQASEQAKLSLTERIRYHAAAKKDALALSLVTAAVADGSSRAMAELLNRVEGKVIDRLETTAGDPFAELDIEELRRLAMGTEALKEPGRGLVTLAYLAQPCGSASRNTGKR